MSKQQKRWVIGGFMIMLFVILIAPTLTNKFITTPYVDKQDGKLKNYVDSTALESYNEINSKLDKLLDGKF